MKIVSFTDGEPGIIAIAQHARGIFALGQMSMGVIAIGQLAVGVVAIGQLGFGLIGVGQLGLGVFAAGGLGVGGRGKGLILKLVPTVDRPRELPPTTAPEAIASGWGDGWIEASLARDQSRHAVLLRDGAVLPIKLSSRLLGAAHAEIASRPGAAVLGHVRKIGPHLVCDRLVHVPVPLTAQPGFWGLLALRMVVLIGIALAWWLVAFREVNAIALELFR